MRILALSLALIVPLLSGVGTSQADASDPARQVQQGKALYAAHCARCHGDDGADTSYSGVKTLVDITQRMAAKEIVEKSKGFATVALEGEDAAALVAFLGTLRSGEYTHPELLVETGWVAMNAAEPGVRVVDLRSAEAYAAGHIPGAVAVAEPDLRSTEDRLTHLPAPEAFAAVMRQAGISNDTHVVIYDDQGGRMATRLWYVLNAYGHSRASVVNGGWNKWTAEGRPVSKETPAVAAGDFAPKQVPSLTCPSPEVLARKPGVVMLDTRSEREHAAARIPSSVNVEWKENVSGPHLTFRPAAELRALYAAKGITPKREIVTYCATGGRASHTLFALKLLGYPNVRVYYGSFTDYTARPEAPVAKD